MCLVAHKFISSIWMSLCVNNFNWNYFKNKRLIICSKLNLHKDHHIERFRCHHHHHHRYYYSQYLSWRLCFHQTSGNDFKWWWSRYYVHFDGWYLVMNIIEIFDARLSLPNNTTILIIMKITHCSILIDNDF